MKVSDLLYYLTNSKVIIETEATIYGHPITVTIVEGNCERLITRCNTELLDADVKSIIVSTIGLIVKVF